MALKLEDKKALVAEVNEVAAKAYSAVAAEYRGLTAGEMDELRSKAREGGAYLRIVKNTLAKRALEGTDFSCMDEALVGPLVMGFSMEDPGAAARVIKDFSKDHKNLVVKAVSVSGQLLPATDIERLASLPTYDQAISMLMGTMQAPIAQLARTLKEPTGKLARTFAALREAKEAA